MPKLGTLDVSTQGFGCMGLSHSYGRADDVQSERTIQRALDLGITLIDTANVYGQGHNEELVGRAIAGRRHEIVLASKFGIVPQGTQGERRVNNEIPYLREQLDGSLKRLGVDHIDLYYVHRIDPTVEIEDTIAELVAQKNAGKIGAIGLSGASAETLRRAAAVHPIAALQTELSLWTRDVEAEILPTTRELGIGFVSYSPLGRGFLAGSKLGEPDDRRVNHPRFQPDALAENEPRRIALTTVAARLGASIAQVSLAWTIAKGTIPIPGTRHIEHLETNWAANALILDAATIAELEEAFPAGSTVGARYPAHSPATVR